MCRWITVLLLLITPLTSSALSDTTPVEKSPVFESKSLLSNGNVETADSVSGTTESFSTHPTGWILESPSGTPGAWMQDKTVALQGEASMRFVGGNGSVTVSSTPVALGAGFQNLNGLVMGKGTEASAKLRWLGHDNTVLREDPFVYTPAASPDGWARFTLPDTDAPEKAERIALVLTASPAQDASYWWDGAEISANYEYHPEASILVNQVGYEITAPKAFVVSANFSAKNQSFVVITEDGRIAYKGTLKAGERIHGANAADWGNYFYRGDFSEMEDQGVYTIQAVLDDITLVSPKITVKFDCLWENTLSKAVMALYASHNPSGASLWEDPGTLRFTEAEQFWYLATAYKVLQWRWNMTDAIGPLQKETEWAAKASATRYAGAAPAPSDKEAAYTAAALAVVAEDKKEIPELVTTAKALMEPLRTRNYGGAASFAAAWRLFALTGEDAWKEQAIAWFPGIQMEIIDELLDYESLAPSTIQPISIDVGVAMKQVSDTLLKNAANPFGVYAGNSDGNLCYFLSPAADVSGGLVGNSYRVLTAAELMARAYRFAARPEFLTFIYDQLNWIFGVNPYGVCLMEGIGEKHVERIVHPKAENRPALVGLILNGIGPAGPGDDRPYLVTRPEEALSADTNGFALRNNVRYINAMAHLKRIRVVLPGEAK